MATLSEVVDKEILDLKTSVDFLLRMHPHTDELTEFYRNLRIVYGKCLSYRLTYMNMLKVQKDIDEEDKKFSSVTQSLIVKGYTQHEREVMRTIGSSESMRKIKEMLEFVDVVMEHCKALERSVYGLMQMAQLDLKLSGMGHS